MCIRWCVDGHKKLRRTRNGSKKKKSPLAAFVEAPRRQRRPHLLEVYSKIFYEDRIKPAVLAELENNKPQGGESPSQLNTRRLRAMHVIRQRMWEAETDEVRATVQETLDRDYPKVKASTYVEEEEEGEEDVGANGELNGGLTPAEAQE